MTRVVHVNSQEWKDTPEDQRVYIGRKMRFRRDLRPYIIYSNPFTVKKYGRDEALRRYRQRWDAWLSSGNRQFYLERLEELRGKLLGCWCKAARLDGVDHACHGDVLVELLNSER